MLIFEWDPEKARENHQKHGVAFAEAAEVFGDDHSSTVPNPDTWRPDTPHFCTTDDSSRATSI